MKKAGYIVLTVAAIAVTTAGLAFAFGTPQAPPSPANVSPPSSASAGDGAASPESGTPDGGAPFDGVLAGSEVPAPDPESPFTFQIPGCRCHSDDPAVVEEHAEYRLNQCRGCHAGSPR